MFSLLFQQLYFHITIDFCHAGQTDSLPDFLLFQQIFFCVRHFTGLSRQDPDFAFSTDSFPTAGIIHKGPSPKELIQKICPVLT